MPHLAEDPVELVVEDGGRGVLVELADEQVHNRPVDEGEQSLGVAATVARMRRWTRSATARNANDSISSLVAK